MNKDQVFSCRMIPFLYHCEEKLLNALALGISNRNQYCMEMELHVLTYENYSIQCENFAIQHCLVKRS